jgi:hypothetical protein
MTNQQDLERIQVYVTDPAYIRAILVVDFDLGTVPTVIAFHVGKHRDTVSNPNHMIL